VQDNHYVSGDVMEARRLATAKEVSDARAFGDLVKRAEGSGRMARNLRATKGGRKASRKPADGA